MNVFICSVTGIKVHTFEDDLALLLEALSQLSCTKNCFGRFAIISGLAVVLSKCELHVSRLDWKGEYEWIQLAAAWLQDLVGLRAQLTVGIWF